jgi:hypothetical protein
MRRGAARSEKDGSVIVVGLRLAAPIAAFAGVEERGR